MHHLFLVPSNVVVGQAEKCVSKILDKNVNLVLWNRNLTQFVSGWTSEIRWKEVQEIEQVLTIEGLDEFEKILSHEVSRWVKRCPDFNEWFVSDVLGLSRIFFEKTGAEQVFIKVSRSLPTENQVCNECLKLICVYAGSEMFVSTNGKKDENKQLVNNLDIVLIKGNLWPNNEQGSPEYCFFNESDLHTNIILELNYKF